MANINQLVLKLSILLKKKESLLPLLKFYTEEEIAEALSFIDFDNRENLEIEENFYEENVYIAEKL